MERSVTARFLHVANGTCTTDLLVQSGIAGTFSIWADPLYDGPVPGELSDEALVDVREGYVDPDGVYAGTFNGLGLWRQTISAHETYDELVLWFEHDLFDQLNLIQLLTWIQPRVPRRNVVSLICVGSFPGYPNFKGLGALTATELASLFDTRQRVTDAQYALAEQAWRAFRSETPEALDQLRHTDTMALPYLAPAIGRFLQEYPSTIDGLSRSERRLLRLADRGPIELASAFRRMHEDETIYYITDGSLAEMAQTLSAVSPSLVAIAGNGHADGRTLHGSLTLTDAGRDVLARRRDRVETCGIDRWLGGVHLRTGSVIWRWDEENDRMTRTTS